jgi:hypothetical protein
MQTSEIATTPVEVRADFLHWSAVIAGALVASAFSLVLITFGTSLGLSVASTAPTWRDTSPILALASGLYLVVTAIVSFGFGGYVAGRLRRSWQTPLHRDLVEFRDGVHGLTAWALAVAITALIAAVIAGAVASRTAAPVSTPGSSASAGETLIAYDLDRLFRSDQRRPGDLTYSRAEASRILLAGTSRAGMKPGDREYLVRLVASQTGIAPAEAEQRVNEVISSTALAVRRTRQTGVIVGFSTAVSLLLGAAAAWYAARLGGEHRDQNALPLRWDLARV